MSSHEVRVGARASLRIEGREGTAPDQVPAAALAGVGSDALPQQAQDSEGAMLAVDARSA